MKTSKNMTSTIIGAVVAAGIFGGTSAAMAASNTSAAPAAPSSTVSAPDVVSQADFEINDAEDIAASGSTENAKEGTESSTEGANQVEATEASDGPDQGADANPNEPGHQDAEEASSK